MKLNKEIYLSIKMIGKRRPIIEKKPLALTDAFCEKPTLENFLRLVVRQEVIAYTTKVADKTILPYLDGKTINEMATHGKVTFGDIHREEVAVVEKAIATALQAFEDGLFLVLIDGGKCETLAQPIQFRANSEVVFLRLVALSGGYF